MGEQGLETADRVRGLRGWRGGTSLQYEAGESA